jgi:hypothetical protein
MTTEPAACATLRHCEPIPLAIAPFKVGPLHTIQWDREGRIYYADEINHSVACQDMAGNLHWRKGGKGSEPARFYYPRGICLGWVRQNGNPTPCLAIADSWNRRIQFLGLDGGFLCEWCQALDSQLVEPVDVKYVSGASSSNRDSGDGYWLILDKGNHALWTADCEGRFLRRTGKCVDPGTAARWLASGEFPNLEYTDRTPAADEPVYDLAYYPSRILGLKTDALFLWEPYSRSLKLIAYGNLMPVAVGSFEDREWVAADSQGFLEWSPAERCIQAYDGEGNRLLNECLDGTPVPSNLQSNEFWLQSEDRIHRVCILGEATTRGKRLSTAKSLLVQGAAGRIAGLDGAGAARKMEPVLRVVDALQLLADEVLGAFAAQSASAGKCGDWHERLKILANDWSAARGALYATLKSAGIGILSLRLALGKGSPESATESPAWARSLWNELAGALELKFPALVRRIDDLLIISQDLKRAGLPDLQELLNLGDQLSRVASEVVDWAIRWHGFRPGVYAPLAAPGAESATDILKTAPHAAGNPRIIRNLGLSCARPLVFRELNPILCANLSSTAHSAPLSLAKSRNGLVFVSLFNSNQVVQIDPMGNRVESVGTGELKGPTGIAMDRDDRLWIADSLNHRVLGFDPPYRSDNLSRIIGPPEVTFELLHGLTCLADHSVLAADPGLNCVFRIARDGSVTRPLCKLGAELDSIRFPTSFCLDALSEPEILWLVDRRNHRLLKLDSCLRGIEQVGGCGNRPGSFFYPGSVAMFADGIIVVSEGPRYPCLIFMQREGNELGRWFLDYFPTGMLVEGNILHVCQGDGSTIRRYERIP